MIVGGGDSQPRSIQISDANDRSWDDRSKTLVQLGRYPEARESLEQTLRLRPKDLEIWLSYGIVQGNIHL